MSARYTAGLPTRSAYENMLAERIRSQLLDMLGRSCEFCGETGQLEINHLTPREWKPRKLSRYRRHKRYLQEAKAGILNVLCKHCNASYRPVPPAPSNPF